MLNANQLLYILPDVAFVTELLPGKKEYTFQLQNFRQINGEYLTDTDFIESNIDKLFSKLEAGEYTLVLPDFLFTNTIIEVPHTNTAQVKTYLKDQFLPTLELDKDTHQIVTQLLTTYAGKTKVQLAALENTVTAAVYAAAQKYSITVKEIVSLSWTLKSIISLEPSISLLQMGDRLYLAQQYIGIDQPIDQPLDDVAAMAETIKTLKGGEPSIQTVYLVTNELIEHKLKEQLNSTLPLQRLTPAGEEAELPLHLKYAIESAARTMSIPDFKLPKFELAAVTLPEKESESEVSQTTQAEDTELPEPTQPIAQPETPQPEIEEIDLFADDQTETDTDSTESIPETASVPEADSVQTSSITTTSISTAAPTISPPPEAPHIDQAPTPSSNQPTQHHSQESPQDPEELEISLDTDPDDPTPQDDVDAKLTQFATHRMGENAVETEVAKKVEINTEPQPKKGGLPRPQAQLLRSIFLSLAVFFTSVAVGVGAVMLLITLTNRSPQDVSPVPQETPIIESSPTPEPSPTPTPTPTPSLNVEDLSVLVVNATSVPGLAGSVTDALDAADFGTTAAANARGDYSQEVVYLLTDQDSELDADQLQNTIEQATGLDLTIDTELQESTEDTANRYDAVVVLADPETTVE